MLIALIEYAGMKIFYFIENGEWYYAYYDEGELIEICDTDSKGPERDINHALEMAGLESVDYWVTDGCGNLIQLF